MSAEHASMHAVISKSTAIPITDGTHSWTWAFWVPATISVFVFGINVCYIFFERRLPNQYREWCITHLRLFFSPEPESRTATGAPSREDGGPSWPAYRAQSFLGHP